MNLTQKNKKVTNLLILISLILCIFCIRTFPTYAADTLDHTDDEQVSADIDDNDSVIDFLKEKAETSRFLKHDDELPKDNVKMETIIIADDYSNTEDTKMIEQSMVITKEPIETKNDNSDEHIDKIINITIEENTSEEKSKEENIEQNNEEPDNKKEQSNTSDSSQSQTSTDNSSDGTTSEPHIAPDIKHDLYANGTTEGPSGHETYYNLSMTNVVQGMRNLGYTEEDGWTYWVRPEDGVKMFGPYVMCAAELSTRPKGTIIQTSVGEAIVCDTGDFALTDPTGVDIATSW